MWSFDGGFDVSLNQVFNKELSAILDATQCDYVTVMMSNLPSYWIEHLNKPVADVS